MDLDEKFFVIVKHGKIGKLFLTISRRHIVAFSKRDIAELNKRDGEIDTMTRLELTKITKTLAIDPEESDIEGARFISESALMAALSS